METGKGSTETLAMSVYNELAKRIINGELKPGARLVESDIAQMFGVSRTPTREAFQKLASDDLIEIIPNKGGAVKGLSPKDIEEIFQLRRIVEVDAAKSSIPMLTQADIAFLERVLTETRNLITQARRGVAVPASELLMLGNNFHRKLVSYCTNSRQKKIFENLTNLIQVIRATDQMLAESLQSDLKERAEILEAVKANDVKAACAGIERHIERSKSRIITFFSSPLARQKHVMAVIMTGEQLWWRTIAATFQSLSAAAGYKVTIMDPELDDRKLQEIVDRIVAARPDGVAFTGVDSMSVNTQVKKIMDAGIPVVPFNVIPKELHGPAVTGDNFRGGMIAGRALADIWRRGRIKETPAVCMLGLPQLTVDHARMYGMYDGFKESFPDATIVAEGIVHGIRNEAYYQMQRILDAHPEVNLLLCSCDAVALGALQALEERGRGTEDDCLMGSVDGSLPGFIKMRQNPRTGYKVQTSYPCYEMAHYTWDTLMKVMDGSATGPQIIYIPSEYISPEKMDAYVMRQYPEEYEAFTSVSPLSD